MALKHKALSRDPSIILGLNYGKCGAYSVKKDFWSNFCEVAITIGLIHLYVFLGHSVWRTSCI